MNYYSSTVLTISRKLRRPMFRPGILRSVYNYPRHKFVKSNKFTLNIVYSIDIVGVDWVKFEESQDDVECLVDISTPGASIAIRACFAVLDDLTFYKIFIPASLAHYVICSAYQLRLESNNNKKYWSPSNPFGERPLGLTIVDLKYIVSHAVGKAGAWEWI